MAKELRGALAALFTCTDSEVLVEGRAGTAKTTGILTKILYRCERFPGSRHLIVRQTRASLTESVLVTLERLLGETHPEVVRMKRDQRHSYHLWDGEIVVGGLDKPERLFSTEWDTVYVPEAIETGMQAWELFGRAMRNNRCDYHQRIADTNPGPPRHWLNQRATPCADYLRDIVTRDDYNRLQEYNHGAQSGKMRRLVSVHQDNPGYWDMNAWGCTKQGENFIRELKGMTGHNRARMLDGRWRAADGTVFPEFDEARHVVTPFTIPSDWPIYWGYDPGVDHPTAILWFAVAPNGCIYIIDEIYGGNLSIPAHAGNVREREKAAGWCVVRRYGDPQEVFNRQKFSARTIASHWADEGFKLAPWPRTGNNSRDMVEAVRKRIIDCTLKVFAPCVNTIGEFQSWSYKRTAKGELPDGDDQFEDKDNHALDVVKGVLATNPQPRRTTVRAMGEVGGE